MAVDIHQAGDDGGTLQINGVLGDSLGENCAKDAVLYFKCTGDELEILGEDSRVFIKHKTKLLYNSS